MGADLGVQSRWRNGGATPETMRQLQGLCYNISHRGCGPSSSVPLQCIAAMKAQGEIEQSPERSSRFTQDKPEPPAGHGTIGAWRAVQRRSTKAWSADLLRPAALELGELTV